MEPNLVLANIGAVATVFLGLLGLFCPDKAATFVSISPVGPNGRSEIRATYGGFFIALGLFCIATQLDFAFLTAGVAWLGASVGRVYSAFADHNFDTKNLGGFVIEAGLGAMLIQPHWGM